MAHSSAERDQHPDDQARVRLPLRQDGQGVMAHRVDGHRNDERYEEHQLRAPHHRGGRRGPGLDARQGRTPARHQPYGARDQGIHDHGERSDAKAIGEDVDRRDDHNDAEARDVGEAAHPKVPPRDRGRQTDDEHGGLHKLRDRYDRSGPVEREHAAEGGDGGVRLALAAGRPARVTQWQVLAPRRHPQRKCEVEGHEPEGRQ
mmetsp:Transcript_90653/g.282294  ORF Transcript_90653/g.282294 Transcript_90653/m.282294 type:complete len:203 (-) Transcript_90653:83-691(-)